MINNSGDSDERCDEKGVFVIVTFPIVGKVFSINSQTFSNKTFLSKRFLVSGLHFLQDQAK